jgi:adenylosuccinate synthase
MATAYMVAGLGFGDEGKGTVVDYLSRVTDSKLVVRYNGGPQAAHNVVTYDGRHHEFHQFGSGSFVPKVKTFLSRFMAIEPYALSNEAADLRNKLGWDPMKLLYMERGCRIITPFHWIANQLREEARGKDRHGSCGMGVGERYEDECDGCVQITVGDLADATVLKRKLLIIKSYKMKQLERAAPLERLEDENVDDIVDFYKHLEPNIHAVPDGCLHVLVESDVVFEGAQGMLLDQAYGFNPYTTWSDCTFFNAHRLCSEGRLTKRQRIGVLRTYFTRHGPGPFVSENTAFQYPDHNAFGRWQGAFRQGHLDLVAARYAARCIGGVDGLAITHCDKFSGVQAPCVTEYKYQSSRFTSVIDGPKLTERLFNTRPTKIEMRFLGDGANIAPVVLESYGPTAADKVGSGFLGVKDSVASGYGD